MATFKIEGLSDLKKNLDEFKKSTQRGILERALKKAAQPIVADAKASVPVLSGELKASIKATVIRTNAGKAAYAAAKQGGGSDAVAVSAARDANRAAAGQGASALVRVAATAPHAIFVEFGARQGAMPAHPYLGPALRDNRGKVLGSLKSDLATEIEKSARRIAARAAKKGTT
ncbi:HK97 gp10 family phage protein [Mesorhizobium sp. BR-1-1-8]|uniref:HK97-gp10 family putative phage morphogenesis protein n=1 Tax=Mesorhizobium sp. BR-1-1-8 TaxID=2876659 RepID=UPI001CCDA948|nr:HK97-gp10 family putative phage morphogenesis protein [Mesorhizobium sp. BR-1-1-8]MBZ9984746.1 HK97 gp10 family phage protein [Mesorhizobium sp. BR-1-1-8]